MPDGTNDFSRDFLAKMDAGDFDHTLAAEIKKLSKQQLDDVAKALIERDSDPNRLKP